MYEKTLGFVLPISFLFLLLLFVLFFVFCFFGFVVLVCYFVTCFCFCLVICVVVFIITVTFVVVAVLGVAECEGKCRPLRARHFNSLAVDVTATVASLYSTLHVWLVGLLGGVSWP